jgi:hypothetical protein
MKWIAVFFGVCLGIGFAMQALTDGQPNCEGAIKAKVPGSFIMGQQGDIYQFDHDGVRELVACDVVKGRVVFSGVH